MSAGTYEIRMQATFIDIVTVHANSEDDAISEAEDIVADQLGKDSSDLEFHALIGEVKLDDE